MSIVQRKRRRGGKQKALNVEKRWKSADIGVESLDNCVVEGFMGLDEITDYDDDFLQSLVIPKKRKDAEEKEDEEDIKEDESTITVENVKEDESTITVENLRKKTGKKKKIAEVEEEIAITEKEKENSEKVSENVPTNVDKSNLSEAKKLNKKQRRRLQRKETFKLKLKERRKATKEIRRKQKEEKKEINNESKPSEETRPEPTEKPEDVYKPNVKPQEKVKGGDVSDWLGLGVPQEVLKALGELKFTSPTPIQKESLPHAIFYRQDIIGAAETGSGKTLAFGIPLIKNIMEMKEKRAEKLKETEENEKDDSPLFALILTPTRELAIQIQEHITNISKYTGVSCVAIVGGLAPQKQERLLGKCPEIVVGTPGRLHTLIKDGELHLNKLDMLKFLVIDECDRMLEFGHFKELDELIVSINNNKEKKQTFLFSATLTLPECHRRYVKKKKDESNEMQKLIDKVGLNKKAKVIDLTTKHVTASMLEQLKVMCANEEKEIYLCYFLMSHPGRTIIFVNTISLTKKLFSLLNLLGCDPLVLHAGKQQKQRLKCLEQFVKNDKGLLIATDVAARGLDIPKVQNVVHFQLPKDPKIYIHRSGRTARAQEEGLSFILEGPQDFQDYKKISQTLKLSEDIPTMKIDSGFLQGIKQRVDLAKKIDKEEYKCRKASSEQNWIQRAAKSMDIEAETNDDHKLTRKQKIVVGQMKKELKDLLSVKLLPKGFSGVYPTRSGGLVVPGLQSAK